MNKGWWLPYLIAFGVFSIKLFGCAAITPTETVQQSATRQGASLELRGLVLEDAEYVAVVDVRALRTAGMEPLLRLYLWQRHQVCTKELTRNCGFDLSAVVRLMVLSTTGDQEILVAVLEGLTPAQANRCVKGALSREYHPIRLMEREHMGTPPYSYDYQIRRGHEQLILLVGSQTAIAAVPRDVDYGYVPSRPLADSAYGAPSWVLATYQSRERPSYGWETLRVNIAPKGDRFSLEIQGQLTAKSHARRAEFARMLCRPVQQIWNALAKKAENSPAKNRLLTELENVQTGHRGNEVSVTFQITTPPESKAPWHQLDLREALIDRSWWSLWPEDGSILRACSNP